MAKSKGTPAHRFLLTSGDAVQIFSNPQPIALQLRHEAPTKVPDNGKRVLCLNIPDKYRYMEPALIDELKAGLSQRIEMPDMSWIGSGVGDFWSAKSN